MLRPKEAAAEIEQMEQEIAMLGIHRDHYDAKIFEVDTRIELITEKIVEIKQQYPSGS